MTANGGQHRCWPPFYVRIGFLASRLLGLFFRGRPLRVFHRPIHLRLPSNLCLLHLSRCRPGREAPGLLPIHAFAQVRAAIRPSARSHGLCWAPTALRTFATALGCFCKLPEKAVRGRHLRSVTSLSAVFAHNRMKSRRKGGMPHVAFSVLLCAGCRPKPLPRIASFKKVPSDTPFPIMKAAVSRIRKSARR